MDKNEFLQYLHAADFRQLFVNSGWDNPTTTTPYRVSVGEATYSFTEAAQKKGFRVYVCKVEKMPDSSVRRVIDSKLRKASHEYLAVYVGASDFHHLWSVPVKSVDKRQLVTIEYAEDDQASFLREKLGDISFALEEEPTIIEVINKVNAAFLVNKDDVTKKFYQGFRKQHDQFVKCIEGIDDKQEREWYSSVMLNRLMFCYFVQKKEFLDLDPMYLQHKLAEVQVKRGEDKFYGTFYKRFLRKLFEDGLNSTGRSERFLKEFGRIPYLNGGMFELHALEKKYKDIDIPDKVFKSLFDFFDQWRWHLDTHLTGTGRDINPDVLGYIFEQYINDRAQMGAYYTKEDITEYIGRNCIIPYLLGKVLAANPATAKWVGAYLRKSGDRYIFPAMLKGIELPLPDYIERGVSTEGRDLRARRSRWNEKADESYALPTEIWRETVARRQRCLDLRDRIKAGKITDIHDFITYNLDIRTFVEDLIRATDDHLFVLHFYNALREVTVLDPTCGSGAFLFAALNILEPLYEACLDRMEEFHEKNKNLFKEQLAEIKDKYRSNQKYFIYKNIILRNLYGVDIMHEATEIARLRLFLKMMAVVDVDPYADNLGLDPLPDIDFNIKCGNTLVGYASEEAVKNGVTPPGTLALFNDEYEKVRVKASDVADCYENFRRYQLTDNLGQEFKEQKKRLRSKLEDLNDLLDRTLAKQDYDINSVTLRGAKQFDEWKAKTQPFHWFTEFYSIIVGHGGFDVIIGNPPYVEYTKKSRETGLSVADLYAIKGYITEECSNLYAYVLERALRISIERAFVGMIIPISSVSNQKFAPLLDLYLHNAMQWTSSYSNRPGKLFDGVEQRLTITIAEKQTNNGNVFYSSSYQHWYVNERPHLFERFGYEENVLDSQLRVLCKIGSCIQKSIWNKIIAARQIVLQNVFDRSKEGAYYHNAPTYFVRSMAYKPNSGKGMRESSHYKLLPCKSEKRDMVACVLNSSLFYFFFKMISNCRDFSEREIHPFPIGQAEKLDFGSVGRRLKESYRKCCEIKSRDYNGSIVHYEEYYPAKSKPIIDEIDEVLAKHYGFTEEELDFIINYDIKYRMGDELNEG